MNNKTFNLPLETAQVEVTLREEVISVSITKRYDIQVAEMSSPFQVWLMNKVKEVALLKRPTKELEELNFLCLMLFIFNKTSSDEVVKLKTIDTDDTDDTDGLARVGTLRVEESRLNLLTQWVDLCIELDLDRDKSLHVFSVSVTQLWRKFPWELKNPYLR